MKNYLIVFTGLLLLSIPLHAQQSQLFIDDLATYNQAVDLYNEDQYQAAQRLFEKATQRTDDPIIESDAAFYIANCAVRLNQRNADALMEDFVEQYPTSTKRNTAFLDVADYYFTNGDYKKAATWYQRVDKSTLSRKQNSRYNFNTGYTLLQSKQYDEAKPYLNRVSDDKIYGAKAKYYLGYIAYEGNELEEADQLFNQVGSSPEADEKLSYYQADLNYKLGRFDKAIALAQEQLPRSNRQEQSQLNRIIGQSLFNQEKYAQALPYLDKYEGTRGKWNNNDYYQLGYAQYKTGDYDQAITTFNKIIDGENATAQNAYYHLAQSYIKIDRSEDALNAFKRASELDYDIIIEEDAAYNYAKISYENGNPYASTPQVLLNFIESYPKSDKNTELNELLIDSYFTSKNYAAAAALLENGRIKGNEAVYARVTFYHGLNLYEDGSYVQAITQLENTLKYNDDPVIEKRTQFWLAQCYYQRNNFEKARSTFLEVKKGNTSINEDDLLPYDLGYTYFKLEEYLKSIEEFTAFTKSSVAGNDAARLNDAYLRIGDANYVSKKYWPGMEAYNKAIELNGPNTDYAAFQKAVSYGYVQKNDEKIKDLNSFITTYRTSQYRDDVMFELGNTYINTGKITDGLRTYDNLIAAYPQSIYTSKAMMRKGLQLYNDNNLDPALVIFKEVAQKYAGTAEASQAISSARQIYIDQGNTNDYAVWVRTLDGVEVTDSELDDTAYESAEQPFIRGDFKAAARQLDGYLKEFPNGKYAVQAHFYLAQSLFATDRKLESVMHYEYVVSKKRNTFTEQALARLSEMYLANDDNEKAVSTLLKLEQLADFPQNVSYARSNLMKAYYELENYTQAVIYANKVKADLSQDAAILSDAQIIIARSSWKTGDTAAARTAYEEVLLTATNALAAEATYYKAYFQYQDEQYNDAIATVKGMTKNYAGYKLWSASGLVIMGKSYDKINETLNATTILQYVVDNFKQYPEVSQEAQNTLNKIKTSAAKTNSSVVPASKN